MLLSRPPHSAAGAAGLPELRAAGDDQPQAQGEVLLLLRGRLHGAGHAGQGHGDDDGDDDDGDGDGGDDGEVDEERSGSSLRKTRRIRRRRRKILSLLCKLTGFCKTLGNLKRNGYFSEFL